MKQKRLFIIIGLIVLVADLLPGSYFFLKASDDTKEWRNEAGQLHRDNDLPAAIGYFKSGEIEFEQWWLDGEFIRSEPAE